MKVRMEAGMHRAGTPRAEGTPRAPKKVARKGARATGWFGFMNLGGKRKGAGRKAAKGPDGKRLHQSHSARETFTWSRPVHVTVKVGAGLPSLRGAVLAPVVLKALEAGNEREGFRLVEFSLQDNHWHLICEAEGPKALSAAIKGMNVRIARAINKRLERKGQVIADRYHLEVLRSPTQVRNALRRACWRTAQRRADATKRREARRALLAAPRGPAALSGPAVQRGVVRVLEGERALRARDAVVGDDREAGSGLLALRGAAALRAAVAPGRAAGE